VNGIQKAFELMGLPDGSFSFALGWMRKGHTVRRRSDPHNTFRLNNGDILMQYGEGPKCVVKRPFHTDDILALDWEVVT
jgi:hypothetical protein